MKLSFFVLLAMLLALAASIVPIAPEPFWNLTHNSDTHELSPNWTGPATGDDTPPPPVSPDTIWTKARCRGERLLKAMTLDEIDSSALLNWPYTQSPWDGDLKKELKLWGYKDEGDEDAWHHCDFVEVHHMERAFRDMGINPYPAVQSDREGHNHCFLVEHENGPTVEKDERGQVPDMPNQWYTVEGVRYRETGASLRIAINAIDGLVFFLDRESPESAAAREWKSSVTSNQLPKVRSASDIAWGFWNRVAVPDKLQNIKMFMSLSISNMETKPVIVPRALSYVGRPTDQVPRWPGIDFIVGADGKEGEAAEALIGSPNGLAAAYFILQHKKQLGGAKFIWKVKIFKADDDENDPNLLFYVDANPPPGLLRAKTPRSENLGRSEMAEWMEPRITRMSGDGKHLVREHVVRAKL